MDELERFKQMTPEEANAYLEALEEEEACSGSCESCGGSCQQVPKIAKKVVTVMGGKGGVGVSTITALLAGALRRQELSVAILDADITTAATAYYTGVTERIKGTTQNFLTVQDKHGVSMISMGLISEDEEEPIIWPDGDKAKIASYFWVGTQWNEPDILLVDMPTSVNDVVLEFMTAMPMDACIIVSVPGKLTRMMTTRSIRLAHMLRMPIMGIVDNFARENSAQEIPALFGEDHPLLASVPYDLAIADGADAGSLTDKAPSEIEFLARMIAEEVRK